MKYFIRNSLPNFVWFASSAYSFRYAAVCFPENNFLLNQKIVICRELRAKLRNFEINLRV